MVRVMSYFPLPSQIVSKKLACPRLKSAKSCQNRIRKAVMTMNSGMIIKRNSLLGNSSISTVFVEPVIAPLIAAMIVSSAMPILYIMHAVMKLVARIIPVTNKQI